ncbi:methyl-accepting chemotaxis protein [Paenibacillus glycinis]|uniref:Methyl-accepting transducer domain-containing protein n=1 Tax=Paenibacillus glycinis TaxID=2697035 RepID=A0ABW9XXX3_9BACL|nr:methyl-accepting chemotaxis protein [Paenibacillus glycinis]NBD27366.1 hypothetical protein [Paenibacillus glycinis]
MEKTAVTEQLTRHMADKIYRLKDDTSAIKTILDLLAKLTQTTTILSLNASIEAARAGAAGRAFMVVAGEIKNLAEQSRQSIGKITRITESIRIEIDDTVSAVDDVYPLFQEQLGSVKESGLILESVQNHMGAFIAHVESMTASIGVLDKSQEQLAMTIGQVGAVSEEALAATQQVSAISGGQLEVSKRLVGLSNQLEEVSRRLEASLSRFTI